MAVYYINGSTGNDLAAGSSIAPWKTLAKANNTLVAGDTVNIVAGVFTNQSIAPVNSGSHEFSPIKYVFPTNYSAYIQGNDPNFIAINLVNKQWIEIHYAKIWGVRPNYTNAPSSNGGCKLKHWVFTNTGTSDITIIMPNWRYANGFNGVFLQNSTRIRILGGTIGACGWWDAGTKDSEVGDGVCFKPTTSNCYLGPYVGDGGFNRPYIHHVGHTPILLQGQESIVEYCDVNNYWGDEYPASYPGVLNQPTGYRGGECNNPTDSAAAGETHLFVENMFIVNQGWAAWVNAYEQGSSKFEGRGGVFRFNTFVDAIGRAVMGAHRTGGNRADRSDHIRCVHNTFARFYGSVCMLSRSAATQPATADQLVDYDFCNNIFYDAERGTTADGTIRFNLGSWPDAPFRDSRVRGNYAYSPDRTLQINVAGSLGSFTRSDFPSNIFSNSVGDPKFVNANGTALADFRLQAASPCKGSAVALTTAVGAGSSSVTLVVGDARYFRSDFGIRRDAYGGPTKDWIRIGTTRRQVSSINYATNTITLTAAASWSNGANIYYDYAGSGPNVGAWQEFTSTPEQVQYEIRSGGASIDGLEFSSDFTVTPSPATGLVSVTWLIDEVQVGTGFTYLVDVSTLAPGSHTMRASIVDSGLGGNSTAVFLVAAADASDSPTTWIDFDLSGSGVPVTTDRMISLDSGTGLVEIDSLVNSGLSFENVTTAWRHGLRFPVRRWVYKLRFKYFANSTSSHIFVFVGTAPPDFDVTDEELKPRRGSGARLRPGSTAAHLCTIVDGLVTPLVGGTATGFNTSTEHTIELSVVPAAPDFRFAALTLGITNLAYSITVSDVNIYGTWVGIASLGTWSSGAYIRDLEVLTTPLGLDDGPPEPNWDQSAPAASRQIDGSVVFTWRMATDRS